MSNVSRFLRGVGPSALLTRFSTTSSTWASFATAAIDDTASHQPSTSGQAGPLSASKELSAASVGAYYALDRALLPEAGRPYAGAFYSPREPGHERRGGCKALQQEVQATGSHAVMYRPVMHALFGAVGAHGSAGQQPQPQPQSQRLLLTGPAGVGKSIALVGLVEWARQQGWLVLYVPSCAALVQGGYFSRRGDSSRWDTLTSAQQLLKGLLDAHGPQLKKMPVLAAAAAAPAVAAAGSAAAPVQAAAAAATAVAAAPGKDPRGRTLHDLVTGALASDDNAELAVDSVLELVRQFAAASTYGSRPTPVLFALDDYNCLYGATDYGWYSSKEDPRKARRRPIHTDELVLASGLRLMDEQQLGGAAVVAATSTGLPLPAPAAPPLRMPYTELRVPGFSEMETRNALAHYHATGFASALATSSQARQLHALTQGNARELRVAASTLGLQLN
ncbi:hypothetical protein PLESTB_000481900 [Pleodorina starrii]|uniref:Small ribosomal subunit protein mS29 n=1 Tax=Pleodorina starrii TaxID=330485 RepID=A0A9W6BGT8_9CHLO|nr:hypothetical protein PLESTM_001584500 [Pleodorina starrii]GLC51246.1 hypothetical protein PLESTB_000481900 [Pleodorina starrii]GLC63605.1 hypothetical protein PLESTF_000054300 [Pleodorina starrii]